MTETAPEYASGQPATTGDAMTDDRLGEIRKHAAAGHALSPRNVLSLLAEIDRLTAERDAAMVALAEARAALTALVLHLAPDHDQEPRGMAETIARGLEPLLATPVPERGAAILEAAELIRKRWDRLTDCVNEFEPEDMAACGEHRDALDEAIVGLIRTLGSGTEPTP